MNREMKMKLAPIALFTYNRPWHTRQTVEALCRNIHADKSELFIFSDGPKTDADAGAVSEVRQYIRRVSGFKQVEILEQERNLGLAQSIIDGVTGLVRQHGRVIVVEDDIVTSPYFLQFINEALERYENDDRVMHVSGYMLPISPDDLPETFFYRAFSCWGWGTWQRAWQHFRKDVHAARAAFPRSRRKEFNLGGCFDFWSQLEENAQGKRDTWAVFWYVTIFLRNGLCLHPSRSLVQNIGYDGSGTHCPGNNNFCVSLADEPVRFFEPVIGENREALARIQSYYASIKPSLMSRLRFRARRALS